MLAIIPNAIISSPKQPDHFESFEVLIIKIDHIAIESETDTIKKFVNELLMNLN